MKINEYKGTLSHNEDIQKRNGNQGSYYRKEFLHDNQKNPCNNERTVLMLIKMFHGQVVTSAVKIQSIKELV
jgi:hypothetical protein